MRPIKYRAFHKELKVMCDVCEINIDHEEVVVSHVKENGWTERNVWFTDEFELMQFTGLHDRNGKEIYESDIVIYPTGLKELVEFQDGVFNIHWCYGNCEVIGSLYENPELLETK